MRTLLSVLALMIMAPAAKAETYTLDQVIQQLAVDFKDVCEFDEFSEPRRKETSTMDSFKVGETTYQVFGVYCYSGAYNEVYQYYLASDYQAPRVVSFAAPLLNERDQIIGFTADPGLVNPGFSVKDNSISFYAKGRGLGDCFSAGTYKFSDYQFVLKSYEVDSKCDGKIKSKKILNYK